jgi:hypothetical protein
MPTGPLGAQVQTFLFVQPVNTLVIHMPALAPEQNKDTPEAKPYARTGNLSHARFEGCIERLGFTPDVPARSALEAHCAGALDTHPVLTHQMANELFALRWP